MRDDALLIDLADMREITLDESPYVYPMQCFDEIMRWLHEIHPTLAPTVEVVALGITPPLPPEVKHTGGSVLIVHGLTFSDTHEEAVAALLPFETCPGVNKAQVRQVALPTSLAAEREEQLRANPQGHRYATDNAWLTAGTDDVVHALREAFMTLPTEKSFVLWFGMAPNLLGNPVETALALASLAFGGVFDRFPHIRFIALHGGGIAPFIVGRWQRGASVRPELAHLSASPLDLLRHTYVDSIVHGSEELLYLIEMLGAEHIVLGSDFPFDMGVRDPIALFGASLSENVDQQILARPPDLFRRDEIKEPIE